MKIPLEIRQKHLKKKDPEAEFFLDHFDEEPKGAYVLEVGANDNHLALMMVECGADITGIDLMPYEGKHKEYAHIIGDFCKWAANHNPEYQPYYDLIYSVSAIEHFGLGTYGKEKYRPYHDVIAMRYIYDLLKPKGVAYIAVPYGGKFVEVNPHWRVYDYQSLKDRIVQDFITEEINLRVVEWNLPNCGQTPSPEYIASLVHGEPYISCLLKLRKE